MKTIKQLRCDLKYTRREMARAVNMPFLLYYLYETHPKLLSVEHALRISKISNTNLSNIFLVKQSTVCLFMEGCENLSIALKEFDGNVILYINKEPATTFKNKNISEVKDWIKKNIKI